MRRKYIVAVLLLLMLGIVSTFALSYQTDTLTENWDTIYTLQYGTSDLQLQDGSGLETELGAVDNDLTVTIPATTAAAVTPQITVEPLDTDGDGIFTASDGSYSIAVSLLDSSKANIETITVPITVSGNTNTQLTGTATFTVSSSAIEYVRVSFDCPSGATFGKTGGAYSSGFEALYEELKLTIEDA